MARHDSGQHEGRGRQTDGGDEQGNDYRGQSGNRGMSRQGGAASWDRGEYGGRGSGEGQGEYGGQGSWAQGEFPGQSRTQYDPRGYGEDYSRQGIGYQGGERYARGPEYGSRPGAYDERRAAGAIPGGYGENYGRMPEPSEGWGPDVSRQWSAGRQSGDQGSWGWEQQSGDQRQWDEGRAGRWGASSGSGDGRQGERQAFASSGQMGQSGTGRGVPGPHSGRGPRGYRRSDARIEEDVCEALTHHGMLDASNIEVKVEGGEVTLTGTVERRQDKRLAEDILDAISGVQDVTNQLRVQSGGQGQEQHDYVVSSTQQNVPGSRSQTQGEGTIQGQSQNGGQRGRQSSRKEPAATGVAGA